MSVRLSTGEEEASVGTGLDLDSTFQRFRYQILGPERAEDALAELASSLTTTTPFVGKTLFRQPLTVRLVGHRVWESDVLYTLKDPTQFQVTVRGRTTGGSQKILGGFATVGTNAPPDQRFDGLIGYNPKTQEAEGAEIIIPTMEMDLEVTYPVGYATSTYLGGLADLTGSVNAFAWGGWQAGQVLYMGAEFSKGNQEPTSITHHIGVQRNLFNVTIAGLSGINKAGWDYLWFLTEKETGGKVPKVKAKYWYVERVYPRTNFTSALGFSKVL